MPVREVPRRIPVPWQTVPSLPPVEEGLVQVVRIPRLPEEPARRRLFELAGESGLAAAVSPDEGVADAILRIFLGRHLDLPPKEVPPGPLQGERSLPDPTGEAPPLHFDGARTGGMALFAFTRVGPLGLALETVGPGDDPEAAQRLSPRELSTLQRLPPGLRAEAFHQCWARKRALVRAVGFEAEAAPCDFDVSVTPGAPPRVHRWLRGDPRSWTLLHLRPGRDHIGAAAVLGDVSGTRTLTWLPS